MSSFRVFRVFRGSLLFGTTIYQPQERMCIEKEFHSMVSFISSNGSSKQWLVKAGSQPMDKILQIRLGFFNRNRY